MRNIKPGMLVQFDPAEITLNVCVWHPKMQLKNGLWAPCLDQNEKFFSYSDQLFVVEVKPLSELLGNRHSSEDMAVIFLYDTQMWCAYARTLKKAVDEP